MPLAALIETLERDADAEVRTMLDTARDEADRIASASASACSERLTAASRAFTDEQRAVGDGQVAIVQRIARRDTLLARDEMLARIREAVRVLLPGVLDDALRAKLRAAAGAEARPVSTGYIAERDNMVVEATLDAILDRAWPQLAPEALALVEDV